MPQIQEINRGILGVLSEAEMAQLDGFIARLQESADRAGKVETAVYLRKPDDTLSSKYLAATATEVFVTFKKPPHAVFNDLALSPAAPTAPPRTGPPGTCRGAAPQSTPRRGLAACPPDSLCSGGGDGGPCPVAVPGQGGHRGRR